MRSDPARRPIGRPRGSLSGRGEIVRAARRLLEQRGSEDALTLRGVAREAGLTAPSVYNHFSDLRAVLEAVIDEAFVEFDEATADATVHLQDPVERLVAASSAYIGFARERPATYRMLFSRHRPSALPRVAARAAASHQALVATIERCTERGRPAGADAREDAVLLWAALHGVADLPPANPRFPWPPEEALVDRIVRRIVLRDPGT